ncbi:MAG: ATP phosphoribosyltransferase regulatory subunit, partial [Deltaproteobacteria bacterium]|nr:ATP phosphoribosyltransferase regulatory subunit [Deltaproteobacteria bacterium]
LDRELIQHAAGGTDILLVSMAKDKMPAQRLAVTLRQQGYSVAREMLVRDRQASLDYARRLHFRYLMILPEAMDSLLLIRPGDGQETKVDLNAVEEGRLQL